MFLDVSFIAPPLPAHPHRLSETPVTPSCRFTTTPGSTKTPGSTTTPDHVLMDHITGPVLGQVKRPRIQVTYLKPVLLLWSIKLHHPQNKERHSIIFLCPSLSFCCVNLNVILVIISLYCLSLLDRAQCFLLVGSWRVILETQSEWPSSSS